MTSLIAHRGPDDSGVYLDGKVGLGVVRLSIIDLSGGHQPISNETGDIWVVFNREIWNYKTLRKELIEKGHHFRTNSDTETIVHAYEEYGLDCVACLVCSALLSGMVVANAYCWHVTAWERIRSTTLV